jgi:serine/threonine kinase 16
MFEHEVAMHRKIGKHPNVIQLIDSALVQQQGTHGFGYLIFPFYKQGTLQDLLFVKEAIGERIPLAEIVKYTNGICQGLMAFHSQSPPLAFRDMKPANVLIDLGGNAILMDLGSVNVARVTVKERLDALKLQESCAQHCTAPFRAPELFDISSNSTFDERTDVWSLGCTLYALAYYQSPFDGSATSAMSGKIPFPSQTPYKFLHSK